MTMTEYHVELDNGRELKILFRDINHDKLILFIPGITGGAMTDKFEYLEEIAAVNDYSIVRMDYQFQQFNDESLTIKDCVKDVLAIIEYVKRRDLNGVSELVIIAKSFGGMIYHLLDSDDILISKGILLAPYPEIKSDAELENKTPESIFAKPKVETEQPPISEVDEKTNDNETNLENSDTKTNTESEDNNTIETSDESNSSKDNNAETKIEEKQEEDQSENIHTYLKTKLSDLTTKEVYIHKSALKDIPTLILHGDKDKIIHIDNSAKMAYMKNNYTLLRVNSDHKLSEPEIHRTIINKVNKFLQEN
jgi:alpha-beta hydrolase superfamily lysophospholipase